MTQSKILLTLLVSALLLGSYGEAQGITPPAVGTAVPEQAKKSATPAGVAREIDWDELLPPDARSRFAAGPPPAVHDYLGEGSLAAQQVMDFSVNKALDGTNIKIPGFIVPLDIGKDGLVSEFFLVPYFGACIHVPPPPPNQIVYVRMSKGVALDSIYEAYWITGRMKTTNKTTRLGASAYQLNGLKVEVYKY
ncbi:MAG: DUF3299 domain-containing protein [Gammaproteobacteria bacterium]|nr:DUF3299 domain-containing protein [Gammaproteobacteria bacterium]